MNKNYTCFKKSQWYFENPDVPFDISNIMIGIKIKKRLYSGRSPFQKIEFLDLCHYGRALALDGIVQTSEKDEFIYHEMLCQNPMFLHKSPQRVLIVGGGDGGSLEEVLKHNIKEVQMVEIDKKVIELSQKYLPSISKGAFRDKRAKVIIGDGKVHIKRNVNYFDVIILDLSDPGGPAKDLISLDFYKNVKRALKKDGMVSIQSGSFTCQPEMVSLIFNRIKKIFPSVKIHKAVVPVYQAGEYSFTVGSKSDLKKITLKNLQNKFKKAGFSTSYWSPELHFASSVLPKYLKDGLIV